MTRSTTGCIAAAMVVALVAALAASGVGLASAQPYKASEVQFYVIVHPSNRALTLDRKFVADAFLKKVTRWGNDAAIRPVDQSPRAAVRRHFSKSVLKRSVEAVRSYWNRIVFSGRGVPPPEVEDDEAVVEYVREHRGAIGYVSPDANLDGVKVVRLK